MPINAKPNHNGTSRLTMIREGLIHLWDSKIVLGAISLDLFAVLLGGVTALLPAYAKDILDIGPEGFGHLRSSFALGGGVMTLILAVNPIKRHAGKWMLGGVTLYGIATLCFAYSREVTFSLVMLAIAGGAEFHFGFRAAESRANRDPRRDARARLGGVGPVHQRVERVGRI